MPDETQARVYNEEIAAEHEKGCSIMFSHGFNIHFGQIVAPADTDVLFVAPKSPGHWYVVHMLKASAFLDSSQSNKMLLAMRIAIGMAYAKGIGCTRAGVIETTFKEETETDLVRRASCTLRWRKCVDQSWLRNAG